MTDESEISQLRRELETIRAERDALKEQYEARERIIVGALTSELSTAKAELEKRPQFESTLLERDVAEHMLGQAQEEIERLRNPTARDQAAFRAGLEVAAQDLVALAHLGEPFTMTELIERAERIRAIQTPPEYAVPARVWTPSEDWRGAPNSSHVEVWMWCKEWVHAIPGIDSTDHEGKLQHAAPGLL